MYFDDKHRRYNDDKDHLYKLNTHKYYQSYSTENSNIKIHTSHREENFGDRRKPPMVKNLKRNNDNFDYHIKHSHNKYKDDYKHTESVKTIHYKRSEHDVTLSRHTRDRSRSHERSRDHKSRYEKDKPKYGQPLSRPLIKNERNTNSEFQIQYQKPISTVLREINVIKEELEDNLINPDMNNNANESFDHQIKEFVISTRKTNQKAESLELNDHIDKDLRPNPILNVNNNFLLPENLPSTILQKYDNCEHNFCIFDYSFNTKKFDNLEDKFKDLQITLCRENYATQISIFAELLNKEEQKCDSHNSSSLKNAGSYDRKVPWRLLPLEFSEASSRNKTIVNFIE